MESPRLPRTASAVPPGADGVDTPPADSSPTPGDSQPAAIEPVPSFVPEALAPAVNPSRLGRQGARRTWLMLAAAGAAAALALGFFFLRLDSPRGSYRGTFTLSLAGRGKECFPEARPVGEPDTLPLRAGDRIVLEARLEQGGPGHFYLIWINSDGRHCRLYPQGWRAGQLPADDRRQADLRWPTRGGAAELRPSSTGLESVLLLVRDRPLGAKENADIDRLLDGLRWRQPPEWKDREIAITWEDGVVALERGFPEKGTAGAEDPRSQTEKLLRALKERRLVSYSRALAFSFAGN